jgi:hypothetical protein
MNWQLGYTPENLRGMMKKHRLSNQAVADMLSVTVRQVHYWRADLGIGHKDMPLYRWMELLDAVGELAA